MTLSSVKLYLSEISKLCGVCNYSIYLCPGYYIRDDHPINTSAINDYTTISKRVGTGIVLHKTSLSGHYIKKEVFAAATFKTLWKFIETVNWFT